VTLRRLVKHGVYEWMDRLGLASIALVRLRNEVIFLTYHSFSVDGEGADSEPVQQFVAQLRYLKTKYRVVGLRDALVHLGRGPQKAADRPLVAITIDDGFGNNYDAVMAANRECGVAPTIFVTTDFLDTGRPPWPTLLRSIVMSTLKSRIEFPLVASLSTVHEKLHVANLIKRQWISLGPAERHGAIEELTAHLAVRPAMPKPLTWDQLRVLQKIGVTVGSHTVYHSVLPHMRNETVEYELRHSRLRIESELDAPCPWIAYPNGNGDNRVAAMAATVGYEAGFTQLRGANRPGVKKYFLKRVNVPPNESLACFSCRAALIAVR
jgi:peptidoglycan/xylan/chitin deacetylase (PgdA/CDA1 family)